ncbi:hypothetical protein [Streptomyces sp. NPDC005374]|uniref:hypothetical protein n=1 Tax=Streptomyces sp. NPDC005374 TaxID=3364713 RepID=UPI003680ED12
MTNDGEASGALVDEIPAEHPEPPQVTMHIPDCERIPLDRLGNINEPTLTRLLSTTARQPSPGFNSSI